MRNAPTCTQGRSLRSRPERPLEPGRGALAGNPPTAKPAAGEKSGEDERNVGLDGLIAEGLSKTYDDGVALEGPSFELRRGGVMGFLGPNGAGKTTAIRILTSIMQPSTGRFAIDGISSNRPAEIRPRIGVLPETFGLPSQITGTEYLAYFAQLYGMRRSRAPSRFSIS